MNRTCLLAALCLLPIPTLTVSPGQGTTHTFQAFYDRFVQAFMTADWKPVQGLVAKGFYAKGPDGRTSTWPQIVADFTQQRKGISTAHWVRTVKSVKRSGGSAQVTVEGHLVATVTGRDKKPHSLKFDAVSLDSWIRTPSGWKLAKAIVVKSTMSMDGQTFARHQS